MKNLFLPLAFVISILSVSISFAGDDYSKTIKEFKASPVVNPFFGNSYGYAVFPTIGKGGIGIGGAHGSGKVYKGGKVTGKTSMTQVTVGFQFGGQAFSQMIFFEDERAYKDFTSGNFEFGAQASAVAITAGAQAKAGSEGTSAGASAKGDAGSQAKAKYHKGMVVFTFAKGGLMYEASLGGQGFTYEPIEKK